jgi:hypothetical protein
MMKWIALMIAPFALGACASESAPGGQDTTFPDAPYATVMTESGALQLAVRTAPAQPPPRGVITVEYTFTDAGGQARDGLDLSVTPWMPEMGHGASVEPEIEPLGDGRYDVSKLTLYMPGRWELRTSIAGEVTDHVVVTLDVR